MEFRLKISECFNIAKGFQECNCTSIGWAIQLQSVCSCILCASIARQLSPSSRLRLGNVPYICRYEDVRIVKPDLKSGKFQAIINNIGHAKSVLRRASHKLQITSSLITQVGQLMQFLKSHSLNHQVLTASNLMRTVTGTKQ